MSNARSLSEAGGQTSFRAAAIRGWELQRRLGVVVLAHGELGVGEGVVGKEVTSMSKPVIQQQDHQQAPWNKGRLVGQKRPSSPRKYGISGPGFKSKRVGVTSPCSTWRSTANCGDATSSV